MLCTDHSNAELDTFGCLLNLAEKKVGCKALRDYNKFNRTGRNQNDGICYDMRHFQNAADEQVDWTEQEMVEMGCVPSCRREIYTINDGIHSKIPYESYIGLLPASAQADP